jgi:hypothetical protein
MIILEFKEDVRVFCGLSLTADCCGLRHISSSDAEQSGELYYRYYVVDQKKFTYMVLKHCIVFNTIPEHT